MTKELLAAQITGREYPPKFLPEETETAKASGLVICYGASDDLVEFEGAIYDEIGAYKGTTFRIDARGLTKPWEEIDKDDEDACADYFKRKTLPGFDVEATYHPWQFKTEMPHATFEIMEDGELFCRGIVFELPK